MSANPTTPLTDDALDGNRCLVWHRLRSEREDICEALIKEPSCVSAAEDSPKGTSDQQANWHKALLEARLRKIDDALDRLMAGSYGTCSRCGNWIEDTKLEFDPAIEFCLVCWKREQRRTGTARFTSDQPETNAKTLRQGDLLHRSVDIDPSVDGVALKSLAPFDTICVHTRNSEYRILLLDPETGRAIVEGGRYFTEPLEARVSGSASCGCTLNNGEIGMGRRMAMWVSGEIVSTSPVQSISVEHPAST